MLLSMEPSGRLLLSPSRGAASRKTDAATRNCGGDPVGYMVKVQGNLGMDEDEDEEEEEGESFSRKRRKSMMK